MKNALERAKEAGDSTLVFTVDMPTPGTCYRDMQSGIIGPYKEICRVLQGFTTPFWAYDVGIQGKLHTLGNVSTYMGRFGLDDYIGWLMPLPFHGKI